MKKRFWITKDMKLTPKEVMIRMSFNGSKLKNMLERTSMIWNKSNIQLKDMDKAIKKYQDGNFQRIFDGKPIKL